MMKQPPFNQMIAIVGGSGSGKGWMSERLVRLLGEHAGRLSLDDFYRDRSHLAPDRRNHASFDVPSAIDWECAEQVLHNCLMGRPTLVPRYDFITHVRLPDREIWTPKPLVVVEGLWLLWRESTRRLFDLKIYLDCPAPVRLRRRIARDVAERGRTAASAKTRFLSIAPLHERYVEPQKQWADLVLAQPFQENDIIQLADRLWPLLQNGSLLPAWMHETFRAELLTLLKTDELPPH